MTHHGPLAIGVAGGTGSGKTTVAAEIVRRVGDGRIALLNHDRYYRDLSDLPRDERDQRNFDHPEALETDLLVEHVRLLRAGRPAPLPVYDFSRHERTPEVEWMPPRPVILVEGILIFAEPRLRELLDIKVFVDTDADLRFIRRLERDVRERGRTVDSVVRQYLGSVRPMHLEFVEPSRRWADVIIPEGGWNRVALDLVISRIERLAETAPDPPAAGAKGSDLQ